jgi:hypothetical protein
MDEIGIDLLLADASGKLHEGHDEMRQLIAGRDAGMLNWRPGPDTNSVAVLVAHAMDAERALTAAVASIAITRDRDAQFAVQVAGPDELAVLIDRIEAEVDRYLDGLDGQHLRASVTRPNGTRTGFGWVLHAVGHTREHLGQANLTLQLREQDPTLRD